jgi:hypothetical protein
MDALFMRNLLEAKKANRHMDPKSTPTSPRSAPCLANVDPDGHGQKRHAWPPPQKTSPQGNGGDSVPRPERKMEAVGSDKRGDQPARHDRPRDQPAA